MTHIGFYLLQKESPEHIACRLIDKAYRQGLGIYVHVADPATVTELDELLWTFRQGSFVPHVALAQEDGVSPVRVGCDAEPPARLSDVLVNLSDQIPLFFSRFERVVEIVGVSEAQRASGRERYRFYRDRGYALQTHTLAA
jgi:DNA polymerase-3 subunit chi